MSQKKIRLAVWKFASCDGCQLTLLDCEDELLPLADRVQIAYFPEASRARIRGLYDLSLVEGSITTQKDAERIRAIRERSVLLVTVGACATAGGIQALRNFSDVNAYIATVYPRPEYIKVLSTSTPVAAHVKVDFELRGCPISKRQLLHVLESLLHGRALALPTHAVCMECKEKGLPCLLVSGGVPCLGPVVQAGCGALCPSFHRGCAGCFGPSESPNTDSLGRIWTDLGVSKEDQVRAYRTFNAGAPEFREAGDHCNQKQDDQG